MTRDKIAHARQIAHDARLRLQERAAAYEATLMSEGYSEHHARSRALQAYGLADAPTATAAPDWDAVPELPREWREAAREHYGHARHDAASERTKSQEKNDMQHAKYRAARGGVDGRKWNRGNKLAPERVNRAFVRFPVGAKAKAVAS